MLEKLARQTAVYGISTIVGRFLSYLLTPYYTRVFGQDTYGIITDVYSLIPFALVLLTMGMESSYFRFSARADAAGGDAQAAKRRLFATTWGITSLAAVLFFMLVAVDCRPIAAVMGKAYVAHPEYVLLVGAIVMFDVMGCIPFSRLREQGRAARFVALKLFNVVLNVTLAFGFGIAGLYGSEFGVGWVLVANLAASVATWAAILFTVGGVLPRIDFRLLSQILTYSLPLLVSGSAAMASEFIDRQMIKYLTPVDAMAQVGVYGAITKIAVVMTLFTQMYRLAAEPFFLANYKKEQFVEMNAAALKYFMLVSVGIFLGISLFRDVFALIVGADFREGIYILPIVLVTNVLAGVWLNLSFWYKREEKTRFAVYVTFAGLGCTVLVGLVLIPLLGYYGAAWMRLASEAVMVVVSYVLNRRYFPTPYDLPRIGEYVAVGGGVFVASELFARAVPDSLAQFGVNAVLFAAFALYAVRRERIDVKGLVRAVLRR
ncbi:MAG: oligosaccharide flippase family protein [Alistipes sp.]|nr:oligosaccharide flippase family protein [Alistipes sp.]